MVVHKWRHSLKGEGRGSCDDGGMSVENCMTSLMDDTGTPST